MEDVRIPVEEQLKNEFLKLEKAANEAKPIVYTSDSGRTYEEAPGSYSDAMVRAMGFDIYSLYVWLRLHHPDTEYDDILMNCSHEFVDFNYEILRVMDDYTGNRPLKLGQFLDSSRGEKFITDMGKIKRSGILSDHPDYEKIKAKMDLWVERVLYQLTWAYCLNQKVTIKEQILQSQTREIDADGNIIAGLTEEDKHLVKSLCDMRQFFMKMLIKIPVDTPEHQRCMDRIENLYLFAEATIEGKLDQLFELTKSKFLL